MLGHDDHVTETRDVPNATVLVQTPCHHGRIRTSVPAAADSALGSDAEKDAAMSEEELKYPIWQGPLQDAIVEFNPERLSQKIQRAEAVVFKRLQELSSDSDHHGERQAIADAFSTLRVLKADKLSYPDWK